uniref:Uncharacterized protein n=1 Tax=Plectus sambesii TaxID=2011161 RepID=A0A914UTE5_9BILA
MICDRPPIRRAAKGPFIANNAHRTETQTLPIREKGDKEGGACPAEIIKGRRDAGVAGRSFEPASELLESWSLTSAKSKSGGGAGDSEVAPSTD